MTRLRTLCVSVVVAIATTMAATTVASADPVASQGNTTGTKYRGGVAGNGGISYAAGLQVTHDAAGTVKVRAAGRISKISKASKVQVDSVALGTATAAVTKNSVPHGSGTANSVISYTAWKTLPPQYLYGLSDTGRLQHPVERRGAQQVLSAVAPEHRVREEDHQDVPNPQGRPTSLQQPGHGHQVLLVQQLDPDGRSLSQWRPDRRDHRHTSDVSWQIRSRLRGL